MSSNWIGSQGYSMRQLLLVDDEDKLSGRLLCAKRDYELKSELQRLDCIQVVILDDIGYLQQSREETEVGSLKLLFSE
jgi:hypothetical protein